MSLTFKKRVPLNSVFLTLILGGLQMVIPNLCPERCAGLYDPEHPRARVRHGADAHGECSGTARDHAVRLRWHSGRSDWRTWKRGGAAVDGHHYGFCRPGRRLSLRRSSDPTRGAHLTARLHRERSSGLNNTWLQYCRNHTSPSCHPIGRTFTASQRPDHVDVDARRAHAR